MFRKPLNLKNIEFPVRRLYLLNFHVLSDILQNVLLAVIIIIITLFYLNLEITFTIM